MNRKKLASAIVSCALTGSSLNAYAALVASGDIELIAPPTSVAAGATESDTLMRLFLEQESFALPSSLDAEVTAPATVSGGAGITPGAVAAGTVVSSYFLHFDTSLPNVAITLAASITFDAPILGLMLFGSSLDASDLILGAPGTTYPGAGDFFRGTAELTAGGDLVSLSNDMRTLNVQSRVSQIDGFSGIDQLRIVLAVPEPTPVPEPTTIGLLFAAMLGAGVAGRRKGAPQNAAT